jgi:two-component sensor histidine kinase
MRLCTFHEGERATFILENNGKDLPPHFDLQADAGLGLSLVKTLVEKDLHGSIELRRHGDWTQAIVHFTLEE